MQRVFWLVFVFGVLGMESASGFRQSHRRTVDGRLCAETSVHDGRAFTGCARSSDPDGKIGQEWCYSDHEGAQHWAYCSSILNYADVRVRVSHAFAEKSNAMFDALDVVQTLSKKSMRLISEINGRCGSSLENVRG